MGETVSISYCQASVQEISEAHHYKGLLVRLNNLLGYVKPPRGLTEQLRAVLTIYKVKRLKTNPPKCSFC